MYYFASDMHLGLDYHGPSRQREALLTRWLDEAAKDARAIFLVGDLFDFWFEYKRVVPKGHTRLLGKLSELTDRGIEVHFFAGNHDMWAFDYLRDECGVILHKGPEVFELAGKRVFIAHGDNMYLKTPFGIRVMNLFFRSRFWQRAFATLAHPNQAIRLGRWWSGKSRKAKHISHDFCGEGEYLVQYAREFQKKEDIDYFVFGHLHCAVDFDMGGGSRAIFLGEWMVEPTYAALDSGGAMELKQYR